jgi:hypothetical protein
MTCRGIVVVAALAFTSAQVQPTTARPFADSGSEPSVKSGDAYLDRSVRAVGDRVAAMVQLKQAPALQSVRADDGARSAEVSAKAQRLLDPDRVAARGRAWRDLGLGSGTEPRELIDALERDVPGMTIDAAGDRLLVDPGRMLPESGHGDPDVDPDSSILLATGVAPDEPTAAHYLAHAWLDGPSPASPVTTDALLAWRALAEGTANLTALTLLFGGVGLESEVVSGSLRPEEVLGGRLVPDTIRSSGPVVRNLLEFVYLDGFAQAASLARKGGFSRIAQERKSRRTTSEIIHLERAPLPVAEMAEPTLPSPMAVVDRDTLGEQGVIALVSFLTGKDNLGLIVGDGWAGDTLWRFEPNPGGSENQADGATIWVTRWRSETDAADFVYGMERCLEARFPGESLDVDPSPGSRVLRRADRIYRVESSGLGVVVTILSPSMDSKTRPDQKKKGTPPRQKHERQ